jgi:hypothetical protein
MVDESQSNTNTARANARGVSIVELFEYVKTYAQQETLGPLKGAWQWLALGTAAAVSLGLGLNLILLGLLRLLQTEWVDSATGRLSWVSYLIVLFVNVGMLIITVSRISSKSLNEEPN